MRQRYPQAGLWALCGLFGKTRNAYYDHQRRATGQAVLEGLVLDLVANIREDLPWLGTRKLHFLLADRLGEHAGRVGRDYLFALLAAYSLLIRRCQRRVITTQTCLPLFCRLNLVEGLTVYRPEQVWVSDITYVRLVEGWSYLSLITDRYSHKIVGVCLHPDLSVGVRHAHGPVPGPGRPRFPGPGPHPPLGPGPAIRGPRVRGPARRPRCGPEHDPARQPDRQRRGRTRQRHPEEQIRPGLNAALVCPRRGLGSPGRAGLQRAAPARQLRLPDPGPGPRTRGPAGAALEKLLSTRPSGENAHQPLPYIHVKS